MSSSTDDSKKPKRFIEFIRLRAMQLYTCIAELNMRYLKFFEDDYLRLNCIKILITNEIDRAIHKDDVSDIMCLLRFLIAVKDSFSDPEVDRRLTVSRDQALNAKRRDYIKRFYKQFSDLLNSIINDIFMYFQSVKFQDSELEIIKQSCLIDLISLDEDDLTDEVDEFVNEMRAKLLENPDLGTALDVSKNLAQFQKKTPMTPKLIPLKIHINLVKWIGKPEDGVYVDSIQKHVVLYLQKTKNVQLKLNFFKLVSNDLISMNYSYNFYTEFRNDFFPILDTDRNFWIMLCDFELYNYYVADSWKTIYIPDQKTFSNFFHTIDYFCTNYLQVNNRYYDFVDNVILKLFTDKHKNAELMTENLIEMYEIFEGCGYLSENRYVRYIREYYSSKVYDNKIKKIVLRGVTLHRNSLPLYKICMTILFNLEDHSTLDKVTNAAFNYLPKNEQWHIIMHHILLVMMNDDSKFDDINRLYLQATKIPETHISYPLTAMYLRWIYFQKTINDTRLYFDSYMITNDKNFHLVEEMLDIECGFRPQDKQRIMALYEFLILNDEKNHFQKWLAEYYNYLIVVKLPETMPDLINNLKRICHEENLARFDLVENLIDYDSILKHFDTSQNFRLILNRSHSGKHDPKMYYI